MFRQIPAIRKAVGLNGPIGLNVPASAAVDDSTGLGLVTVPATGRPTVTVPLWWSAPVTCSRVKAFGAAGPIGRLVLLLADKAPGHVLASAL